ncbi:DUF6747 family protein [uncultured Muriicola sp.]|uniref:DUF6747 family protein n=1 Tax=uncultured Muriicola sp. TaxID=1583102 RepID=UPI00345BC53E
MKTLLLFKEIYLEAFKQLENFVVRRFFRIFAWFSFILCGVVLYALIYRIITGFAFD